MHSLYFTIDIGETSVFAKLMRGVLILICVLILSRKNLSSRAETIWRYLSFLLMMVAGVLSFMQTQLTFDVPLLSLTSTILGNIALIWVGGMWIQLFARMPVEESFFYIITCLGLGSLLGFLFGYLPSVVVAMTVVFIPVLIFLGYEQAVRSIDARDDSVRCIPHDVVYDREPRKSFVILLVGMMLFVFTLGIAQGFPSGGNVSFSRVLQAVHQLSIVLICSFGIVWVFVWGRGLSFRFAWGFEAILAICSLTCYMAPDVIPVELGVTFAIIPITLWLGLSFLIADDISRHTSRPPYIVLGIIYGIYQVTFNLGRVVSFRFGGQIEQSVLVIGMMIFLLALSMTLVLGQDLPRVRPFFDELAGTHIRQTADHVEHVAPPAPDQSDWDDERLEQLTTMLRGLPAEEELSEREIQVAILVARGRTRKYIAENLFISENTVRNHVRSIYRKLGVHTKQEFLDLLE